MNRPGSYGYPLKNVIEVGGGVCSYNFQIHLVFFFFAAAVRPIFWSVPHFGHVFRSHLVGSLGHGRWKLMSGP